MTDTAPPPPPRNNGRLAVMAVLLLLVGGGLLWWALQGEPAPAPVAAAPDAGPPPQRALGQSDLILPDDIPDGGPPVAEVEPEPADSRRPRPASSSWECSGDLDRAAAASVISSARPQVQACYERALKQNNLLQGKLNVDLRIAANGSVDAVRFGGSLTDPEVRSCVRRLTRGWRFPAPGGSRCAVVSVPFDLTPRL